MAVLTRPGTHLRGAGFVLAAVLFLAACSEELLIDVVNRCDNPVEYYEWSSWPGASAFDIESPPSVGVIDASSEQRWTGLARAERIDLYDLNGEVVVTVAVPDGAEQIEIVIDGQACAQLAAQ